MVVLEHTGPYQFQSTRPVRGGTSKNTRSSWSRHYFNPPAPCGAGLVPNIPSNRRNNFNPPAPCGAGRGGARIKSKAPIDFNPPAPCGAGHSRRGCRCWGTQFQSTRPVRGGTRTRPPPLAQCTISIHPPRAGRDVQVLYRAPKSPDFNPPAPCGAGPAMRMISSRTAAFQSTRPVRGGTTSFPASRSP